MNYAFNPPLPSGSGATYRMYCNIQVWKDLRRLTLKRKGLRINRHLRQRAGMWNRPIPDPARWTVWNGGLAEASPCDAATPPTAGTTSESTEADNASEATL